MTLHDIPLRTLTGEPTSLADYRGRAVLLVNVASKCGLTPQYEGLVKLQNDYADRGFTVLGVPCNQFALPGAGEPGGDPDLLLDHVRGQLPAAGEDRGERRGAPPALRRAGAAGGLGRRVR